jgi:hypothetical protein
MDFWKALKINAHSFSRHPQHLGLFCDPKKENEFFKCKIENSNTYVLQRYGTTDL